MLFKKPTKTYDKTIYSPALHKSICTGETVAGFINNQSGEFKDVLLIRSEKDLNSFLKLYNIQKDDLKMNY